MDCTLVFLPMALLMGWLLDVLLGDPIWLPHPVVYFGKWIAFGERHLNQGSHRKLKGAIFSVGSIFGIFVLAWCVFCISAQTISYVLTVFLIFFCLAGHTLRREVKDVFRAVDDSLEAGRKQVGRIVGRDTSELSAQEIRTAALETLAENLSDGVIAPLFWLLLLGVPGMLTYKMVNTFDSMIGYQNLRYKDFGCWAARIDDVANYIPARLTAFLIVIIGWILGRCQLSLLRLSAFVFRYGCQPASPNSGWPEAALAAILDCRFGGSHQYFGEYCYKPFIGSNPRLITTTDMLFSIRICLYAEIMFVVMVGVVRWIAG